MTLRVVDTAGLFQQQVGGGAGAFSGGMSTEGNTAGTTGLVQSRLVIVGSNNITISQSVNGQSATLSIIGGAGGGGSVNFSAGTTSNNLATVVFSNSNGVSFGLNGSTITGSVATSLTNINLSAGTTSNNLSAFILSNSNGISFGLNGSTITGSYTVPVQSNGILDVSTATASGTATSQFAMHDHQHRGIRGIAAVGTATTFFGDFNLSGGNGVTLITGGNSTAGSVGFSVANQSNQQMTLFATGNTTQSSSGTTNASSLIFNGAGIASVGITGGSIVISVPAGAPSPVNFSAGTTSGNLASVVFSDSNNVSFGLNGATITATATVASTQGSIVISAGTTSNTGSQFVFSNSNGITFGLNGSTVTASVSQDKISHFMFPPGMAFLTNFTLSNASMSLQHVNIPQILIANRVNFLISLSGNSGSSGALTLSLGVYTMAGSTLSLASSDSRNLTWTSGSDTSASSRYGGVSGARYRTVSLNNWSLTPGDYMIGLWFLTTNNGTWRAYGRQGPTIVGAVDVNETQHYHDGLSGASFTTAMPASWNVTNTDWVRTGGDALKQAGFVLMGSF